MTNQTAIALATVDKKVACPSSSVNTSSAGPTSIASHSVSFESDDTTACLNLGASVLRSLLQRTGKVSPTIATAFKSSLTQLETRVTNLALQAAYALLSSTDMRNQNGTCPFELRPSSLGWLQAVRRAAVGMMIDCLADLLTFSIRQNI